MALVRKEIGNFDRQGINNLLEASSRSDSLFVDFLCIAYCNMCSFSMLKMSFVKSLKKVVECLIQDLLSFRFFDN